MNNKISYVKVHGGVPTLFVEDKPYYSPAYVTYMPERNCYASFEKAGIHMYSVCFFFGGQPINPMSEPNLPAHGGIFEAKGNADFTEPDKALRQIIDADPEARIFPRVNISPPAWWEDENPDELNDLGAPNKERRRVCFASEKWRFETAEMLKIMAEHYKSSELGKHIIGYQIACGCTEEWFPFDMQGGIGKRVREKFEKIKTPETDELDIYKLSADETVDAIMFFAEKLKEYTDNRMVIGAFYGYTLETPIKDNLHFSLSRLLRSPNVDFLCSPASYANVRCPGADHACMTVLDSVLLHGKLYFTEADERTHLSRFPFECQENFCKPGNYNQPIWLGPKDPYVARHVLRNAFCRQLIHSNNFWWFDMWGGWYEDEGILSDMQKEVGIFAESVDLKNRENIAEVAVIIDENCHLKTKVRMNSAYKSRIPLGCAGAPYAIYELSDFETIKDKYKAFVLLEPASTEKTDALKKELEANRLPFITVDEDTELSPALFRDFYKKCGVHIFCDGDHVVHVNNNYLSVQRGHETKSDKVILHLNEEKRITPLFDEGESVVSDTIELTLKPYETRLFRLE